MINKNIIIISYPRSGPNLTKYEFDREKYLPLIEEK
jgi:hypothetical protein